jgi:hypothetical protein
MVMDLACPMPLNLVNSFTVIRDKTESIPSHCDKMCLDRPTADCVLLPEPISMAISSALLNTLAPFEISFSLGLSSSDHDFIVSFLWLIKTKIKKKASQMRSL